MNITQSNIFPEVFLFELKLYKDDRGFFTESYNKKVNEVLGVEFYQDNHSMSNKNVIRGIHYQWEKPMGKLCRVIKGSVIDIVVDLRSNSSTFGKNESFLLSEENNKMIWIPPGFGHAFLSLEDDTHFFYKCSAYHNSDNEGSIYPFDENLNIDFPISKENAVLSLKDMNAQSFKEYCINPRFL